MIGVLGSLGQPLPVDPTQVSTPAVDWAAVAPLLVLVGGALVLMLASAFVRTPKVTMPYTVVTCLVVSVVLSLIMTIFRR